MPSPLRCATTRVHQTHVLDHRFPGRGEVPRVEQQANDVELLAIERQVHALLILRAGRASERQHRRGRQGQAFGTDHHAERSRVSIHASTTFSPRCQ